MPAPLMPKATAVWLVENTSLTFDQIADFMLLQKITPAKVDFRKSLQLGFYKE